MKDNPHTPTDRDDQWVKLFYYLDQRFGEVKSEIQDVRDDVNQLRNVVDGLAADVSTLKDETLIRNHQLDDRFDRHEGWIKRLADYSQIKLEP